MKLFSSFRYVLALAIGGLLALGSPILGVDVWAQGPAVTVAPIITTYAGNGIAGGSGDDGPAVSAELNSPIALALDTKGTLYVGDETTGIVRTIGTNGIISALKDTNGVPIQVGRINALAVDQAGNVYYSAGNDCLVKKIIPTGSLSVVAGTVTCGYNGDNIPATTAMLSGAVIGLATDAAGNLYITDANSNRIRKVNVSGTITTIAGTGILGFSGDGAPAINAKINTPWGITVDSAGTIYFVDGGNYRVRKITSGIITTIAGNGDVQPGAEGVPATSVGLQFPTYLSVDSSGNLYIAETYTGQVVLKVNAAGILTTFAGNHVNGFSGDGGPATSASLGTPQNVVTDSAGNLYIAEFTNNRIRRVQQSILPFPDTQAGQTSPAQNIYLQINQSLTITSFNIPQAEGGVQEFTIGTVTGCSLNTPLTAGTICTIPVTFSPKYPGKRDTPLMVQTNLTNGNFSFGMVGTGIAPQVSILPGITSTVAGNGTTGNGGDNGPAISASVQQPMRIVRDAAGNMYISAYNSFRIRKVDTTGTITTVAGTGTQGNSGDGGPAVNAAIGYIYGLSLDSAGNLYLADSSNNRIRKIDVNGIISTVVSSSLNGPSGVWVDGAGTIWIADTQNNRIRKVVNGVVTNVAGTGVGGFSGDGGPAVTAQLQLPTDLVLDHAGNIYFCDYTYGKIRRIDAVTGIITTVAGNGSTTIPNVPGGIPAAGSRVSAPFAIAIDAAANLYIATDNGPVYRLESATQTIRMVANSSSSKGVAVDSFGNIYVAEYLNYVVRQISVNPRPLFFPDTAIGQASSLQNVLVSNIGNGELNFAGQATSPDFFLDSSGTCVGAPTLAMGDSCTLAIGFKPQQTGARTGTATMTDDALNIPGSTQTVQLSGNGLPVDTTIVLSLSTSNSIDASTPVTLTANVSPFSSDGLTRPGFISFFDNNVPLFTGSLQYRPPARPALLCRRLRWERTL